jgi:hypothetical protein
MHVDSSIELGRNDPALEFPWASDDGSIHYVDLKNNPALIDDIPEAGNYRELRDFLLRLNAPRFPLQTAKSDIWITHEILPEEEIFAAPQKLVSYVDLVFSSPEPRFSLDSHLELVNKLCTLLQHAPEMPVSIEFILRHCYYHEAVRAWADQHEFSPAASGLHTRKLSDLNNSSEPNTSGCAAHRPLEPSEQDLGPPEQALEPPEQDLEPPEGKVADGAASLMSKGAGLDLRCGFSITVYVSGFGDDEQEARQRWSIALKLLQHALVQVVERE